mmetsp:Transcript_18937/g.21742  ORF Transcript_18937/g.21742 Transcript_18937/m.21742 type:complete len:86 (+) Transcript_18937:4961-5218(+)
MKLHKRLYSTWESISEYPFLVKGSGWCVSVPIRHLTVTGIFPSQPSCKAFVNSETSFGESIKAAPKLPFPATLGLGQPQFKFIAV